MKYTTGIVVIKQMRQNSFKEKKDYEMLKVRKKTKFCLDLRLHILQTKKARAFIFCVVVYLEVSNINPRSAV